MICRSASAQWSLPCGKPSATVAYLMLCFCKHCLLCYDLHAQQLIAWLQRVLLMDEISTGLDSATTYSVAKFLSITTHVLGLTTMIGLLQPPPEVYAIFDDVLLLTDGYSFFCHLPCRSLPFLCSVCPSSALPFLCSCLPFLCTAPLMLLSALPLHCPSYALVCPSSALPFSALLCPTLPAIRVAVLLLACTALSDRVHHM